MGDRWSGASQSIKLLAKVGGSPSSTGRSTLSPHRPKATRQASPEAPGARLARLVATGNHRSAPHLSPHSTNSVLRSHLNHLPYQPSTAATIVCQSGASAEPSLIAFGRQYSTRVPSPNRQSLSNQSMHPRTPPAMSPASCTALCS